jgi:Protein of unknown function (DUF1592)/Protein of unknown function (DUF1588)/Protein of unknown function (DUF1587)/Protein of unknown function (DUF1585)/Protein of unknown function (DUF1595)
MPLRTFVTSAILFVITLTLRASAPQPSGSAPTDLERRFANEVRPFVETYCLGCHRGPSAAAQFDLQTAATVADVARDQARWGLLLEKLEANQMPPAQAKQPPLEAREKVIAWVDTFRRSEARKNAGDPGIVLARRLSNAEYNYTIRDLTGVDIRPAREFPVDPANPAGFDNSGESLAMSPALLSKYLQAAQDVANHLVLKPKGFAFAPHPMLVETDLDKYCVNQIIEFYRRQNTDYAAYFEAAWRFKQRRAPRPSLAEFAKSLDNGISAKYLATILGTLEDTKQTVGPIALLQAMWRELARLGESERVDEFERMRDYVVRLRKKIELKHTELSVKGIGEDTQPFLMWRNKQYASGRLSFDLAALQVQGDASDRAADPDLVVPPGQRARYEAAFARFASVFPDAFYVSERGRYFPDNTRDVGRHLSAGFHNLMGYFRDDRPLYELMLDEVGQKQLDAMWRELDFVAAATTRTYVQFYLSESGEARKAAADAIATGSGSGADVTSAAAIQRVADSYLERAKLAGSSEAIRAIEDHFAATNETIRWVEKARREAEPTHLAALQDFAARAFRRPLTAPERADLLASYRAMREQGLEHIDAIRDSIVGILMSPDFCYRFDLSEAARETTGQGTGGGAASSSALTSYALASRLSYFLWSSMPDAQLLARAAAGDLQRPEVLASEARRMVKDARVRALATEFGGNWLDFRRFEEHNAVDRERFRSFDNELRQAMFEEPIRFMLDVFGSNRSILDFLYADHTFINPTLAKHYGIPVSAIPSSLVRGDGWVRVDDAKQYARGGLLPMSVFLTKNAPGLRTSPVKRGYWVVKQVLGEHIPPPPAMVPELPRDEAKLDLSLRDLLARHREDKSCASCHARFDSLGLVFEGYGPIGERRTEDLSGRPIDASATFPGGSSGTGFEGLREYLRQKRQDDFVENLSRKLLAYALNRSLILSDDITIDAMTAKLVKDGYRFDSLVEAVVTSSQFRNKRASVSAPSTPARD